MAWWTLPFGRRRTASADRPSPEATEFEAVLSGCCAFRSPAVLLDRDRGGRFAARFAALGERDVVLDLEGAGPLGLTPLSVCLVSFAHRGRSWAFVTSVRRVEARERQVSLRRPSDGTSEDLRGAFRVPTPPRTGLAVRAHGPDGRAFEAAPVNVSMSGALLDFPDEDFPHWPRLAPVELELRLAGNRVRVAACVQRREGPRAAFFFPDAVRDGEVEPPASLAGLVRTLERTWLRERAGRSGEVAAAP